jgi:two-component system, response regulator FlrC
MNMAGIRCAKGLEKNHRGLAEYAATLLGSLPQPGEVLLCGAADDYSARRRDDRVVLIEQGEVAAIRRAGSNAVRLTCPIGEDNAARAALLAAATVPGQPVAADTGSLAMLTLAARVAASEIPVLVEGPTGTGKEVLARFIHAASSRAAGPFVAINCAAMPEAMLEAMLFGHRKGAFTGATEAAEGFFRAADGGTLLLDELGEMPLSLQAKLLRALQEGEVVPLGATQPIKVDVRIIACTNRDLAQEIAAGRFREDLYYRLNVFPLRLDALRMRPDDIAPLAFAMLLRHSPEAGPRWIGEEAIDRLRVHAWPGNVRELENVIRRALLLAGDEPIIQAAHVVFDSAVRPVGGSDSLVAAVTPAAPDGRNLSAIVRRSEAQVILDTLDQHHGNRLATAAALGISERTLRYRLASMREAGLVAAGGAR